jgi:hypothetical protein
VPVTLNSTPGDPAANTFATLAYFKAFIPTRLPGVPWAVAALAAGSAGDDTLSNALIAAARELKACFRWNGVAANSGQALPFPRIGLRTRNGETLPSSGTESLPTDLLDAQCEWALQLGAGDRLSDNDALAKGVSSVKAGSVEVAFQSISDALESVDTALRRARSDMAYVSGAVPDEVRRLLVPGWYKEASVKRSALIGFAGGTRCWRWS